MASNQTGNYGLNQWEATDQVLRTEFNADNSKIDAALKGLADKDAELEGTLAGQAADIAKLGNCSIERFTYTGADDDSATVSFSKAPLLFIIISSDDVVLGSALSTKATSISYDQGAHSTFMNSVTISWSGNTVSVPRMDKKNQFYQVFGLSCSE